MDRKTQHPLCTIFALVEPESAAIGVFAWTKCSNPLHGELFITPKAAELLFNRPLKYSLPIAR